MAGCVLAAGSVYGYTEHLQQEQMAYLSQPGRFAGAGALSGGPDARPAAQYLGAAALTAGRPGESGPRYLGAAALSAGREDAPAASASPVAGAPAAGPNADGTQDGERPPFVPDVLTAKKGTDRKMPWCSTDRDSAKVMECVYGDTDSDYDVVLVGDSKANQLVPALKVLAERNGWELNVYAKVGCALADVTQRSWEGSGRDKTIIPYKTCDEWNRKVMREIKASKPDLLITTSIHSTSAAEADSDREAHRLVVSGFRRTWREIAEAGVPIVVLRDTPRLPFNVPDCVAQNMESLDECSVSRREAFEYFDPLVAAAKDNDDVTLLDLSDAICTNDRCPPVVGSVLVYRDHTHLTSTYVETMIPYLQESILTRR